MYKPDFRPLIVTAVATLLSACGGGENSAAEAPNALLVSPFTLSASAQYAAEARYSGQVEAARESALGFELGGELAAVSVDEGDTVAAGTVLARLDQDRLQTVLGDARAAASQAEAQLKLAATTYERVANARSFDGVSTQEVDQAEERLKSAESAVAATRVRVARARVDLEQATLRAPYDGTVVARRADEGQIVAPGQTVIELQEAAALEVRLAVAGDALEALQTGTAVSLTVDSQPVAATVKAIIARRNLRTRAVEVILTLDEGAAARVGDIAELAFARTYNEAGFWVPLAALTEGARGVWNVLAIVPADDRLSSEQQRATGATHMLENRPVELIHQTEEAVYIRGAIAAGERIVAEGLHRVVRGQGVRVDPTRDPSLRTETANLQ